MIIAPRIPSQVKRSGFTQAGIWAENHCKAGLSMGPSNISFTLSCELSEDMFNFSRYGTSGNISGQSGKGIDQSRGDERIDCSAYDRIFSAFLKMVCLRLE